MYIYVYIYIHIYTYIYIHTYIYTCTIAKHHFVPPKKCIDLKKNTWKKGTCIYTKQMYTPARLRSTIFGSARRGRPVYRSFLKDTFSFFVWYSFSGLYIFGSARRERPVYTLYNIYIFLFFSGIFFSGLYIFGSARRGRPVIADSTSLRPHIAVA